MTNLQILSTLCKESIKNTDFKIDKEEVDFFGTSKIVLCANWKNRKKESVKFDESVRIVVYKRSNGESGIIINEKNIQNKKYLFLNASKLFFLTKNYTSLGRKTKDFYNSL